MIVPVYGNPCAMDAIVEICKRRNLILIEDCCEALGAYYDGKAVGRFGRVGTFSFYFSHHLTTLEGGITVTDDFELAELMRILRAHGWVREVKDRERWLKKYPEFDPRFLFVERRATTCVRWSSGRDGAGAAAQAQGVRRYPPHQLGLVPPRVRRSTATSSTSRKSSPRAATRGSASRCG